MDLCDRIIVLCHGEITGIVDPDEVTKEDIGLLMTGKKDTGGGRIMDFIRITKRDNLSQKKKF